MIGCDSNECKTNESTVATNDKLAFADHITSDDSSKYCPIIAHNIAAGNEYYNRLFSWVLAKLLPKYVHLYTVQKYGQNLQTFEVEFNLESSQTKASLESSQYYPNEMANAFEDSYSGLTSYRKQQDFGCQMVSITDISRRRVLSTQMQRSDSSHVVAGIVSVWSHQQSVSDQLVTVTKSSSFSGALSSVFTTLFHENCTVAVLRVGPASTTSSPRTTQSNLKSPSKHKGLLERPSLFWAIIAVSVGVVLLICCSGIFTCLVLRERKKQEDVENEKSITKNEETVANQYIYLYTYVWIHLLFFFFFIVAMIPITSQATHIHLVPVLVPPSANSSQTSAPQLTINRVRSAQPKPLTSNNDSNDNGNDDTEHRINEIQPFMKKVHSDRDGHDIKEDHINDDMDQHEIKITRIRHVTPTEEDIFEERSDASQSYPSDTNVSELDIEQAKKLLTLNQQAIITDAKLAEE
ncbi:hypothetical protein RFI_18043 [Reticulomyxa filosa]|uniref:Uncharacterized protein n=1 Tax=Reticulomyxa filosa TaxID=46433 RepID=X6MZC7_RETFI|nr:hypothetical protein RFI_18043 [Reticulomyxa filosa]|eukprot:ETO19186.1 hypothetical protein RFI_18043 [Reticulomyxa filosa]